MFANLIISRGFNQKNPNQNIYEFISENTFMLPVEKSLFSFQGLAIIGDFDKRPDKAKISFEMFHENDMKNNLLKNLEINIPSNFPKDDAHSSVTLKFEFNNVQIPHFGHYYIIMKVNEDELIRTEIEFKEIKNVPGK